MNNHYFFYIDCLPFLRLMFLFVRPLGEKINYIEYFLVNKRKKVVQKIAPLSFNKLKY